MLIEHFVQKHLLTELENIVYDIDQGLRTVGFI